MRCCCLPTGEEADPGPDLCQAPLRAPAPGGVTIFNSIALIRVGRARKQPQSLPPMQHSAPRRNQKGLKGPFPPPSDWDPYFTSPENTARARSCCPLPVLCPRPVLHAAACCCCCCLSCGRAPRAQPISPESEVITAICDEDSPHLRGARQVLMWIRLAICRMRSMGALDDMQVRCARV